MTNLLLGFALVQLAHMAIGSSIIENAILLSVVLPAVAFWHQRTKITQKPIKKAFMMAMSLFGLTLFHGMAHAAVEMPVQ